ncbi:MAG: isoprenylcysteine carboxylmethyltransferase family protein [Chromatiales bacterium]|nr:isoprenylcysteine carboxylmethyltransferase family protein [Chromatiales bacterium]
MLDLLLPVYGAVFIFTVFFLRTLIVWKKTGINAYALLKQSGPNGVIGLYFKLIPAICLMAIAIFSFFPEHYSQLGPIVLLESPLGEVCGSALLLGSLVLISIAQAQMGRSWRIGIDMENRTDLVTGGLFAYSRNPIFLGMKLTTLGLFLIMPNAITLSGLVLSVAVIDIQVALEEQHLTKLHGQPYADYCKRVRRWI